MPMVSFSFVGSFEMNTTEIAKFIHQNNLNDMKTDPILLLVSKTMTFIDCDYYLLLNIDGNKIDDFSTHDFENER